MDVIERLHAAVTASGLSKKKVAHIAGISPSRLSRLLNGRLTRPSIADIEAVLAAIGMRMEDLFAVRSSVDVRQALRVLIEYVDRHEMTTMPVAEAPRVRPRMAVAASPNAILLHPDEPIRKKIPPALWARGARGVVRAVGDSMAGAGIRDGDLVFFAPAASRLAARGKIVVIRVNRAVCLKYYEEVDIKRDDEVELYGIVILPRRR